MKLSELKTKIKEYQYFEDTDVIDVSLASIVASRLKLGDPIWLIIIGPSSGGKSQILRPLSLTDPKFMHRVDDVTENTFLSGSVTKGGGDISLLKKIGPHGVMVISDLTVLFSKNPESRNAILSQFRMIYDGEMIKHTGSKDKITWKGYLGIIAGSTPSIYSKFEEVADMGERFIYYRMKPFNAEKATRLSMNRKAFGKGLDDVLAASYLDYLKAVTPEVTPEIELAEEIKERIIKVSVLAEKIRTTTHLDWQNAMDRLPVAAMPMRVSLQLVALMKGLYLMRKAEGLELKEKDVRMIEWCGYSLANEEKRAALRFMARLGYGIGATTGTIADYIGLSTDVSRVILQNMAATGVLTRTGTGEGLSWQIADQGDLESIRRFEGVKQDNDLTNREVTREEGEEHEIAMNKTFDNFGAELSKVGENQKL